MRNRYVPSTDLKLALIETIIPGTHILPERQSPRRIGGYCHHRLKFIDRDARDYFGESEGLIVDKIA
jgi:hypothetical protein